MRSDIKIGDFDRADDFLAQIDEIDRQWRAATNDDEKKRVRKLLEKALEWAKDVANNYGADEVSITVGIGVSATFTWSTDGD